MRLCTEDVLLVRNLRKCFLNYETTEKRHTKQNGWWNLDACPRLPTTEITKRTLTLQPKPWKKKLFCCCVVYLFSRRTSLFWVTNKQTENLKSPYNQKSPWTCGKIKFIKTANESFNCNGVPLFAARNFSSNRNVAFLARSLGPTWSRLQEEKCSSDRFRKFNSRKKSCWWQTRTLRDPGDPLKALAILRESRCDPTEGPRLLFGKLRAREWLGKKQHSLEQ